jgi:ABC-type bacteriocin/lantibiotic exporter with double-glycine peptidase domain
VFGQTMDNYIAREISAQHRWRDAEHGGLNALYVLLRLRGFREPYERCLVVAPNNKPPNSLSDLIATAKRLGYRLQSRRLSPDELEAVSLPVIVHLDGDDPSTGGFLLLLAVHKRDCLYMDGPSATINTMEREGFFRRWSGIVVYPEAEPTWPLELFAGIAVAAVAQLYFGRGD